MGKDTSPINGKRWLGVRVVACNADGKDSRAEYTLCRNCAIFVATTIEHWITGNIFTLT